jgi:hypothetical protein
MKKALFFICLFISFVKISYSQQPNVSPGPLSEICPYTNTNFTVTLAGNYTEVTVIASTGGPILVFGPSSRSYNSNTNTTTFNFVGSFADINQPQSFRITYGSNSHTFTFTRIKSLNLAGVGPYCGIVPSISTFDAPRCQVVTRTITFNNIQFNTSGESTCWGPPITSYEYLIPSGWTLDGTLSNGSTWIQNDNNVTITSNLDGGLSGSIQIRAVNTACGTTLSKSQIKSIPINRPAPSLSITTSSNFLICSGSKIFGLNGLPSMGSTNWSISSNYGAGSLSNESNTTVTVTKTNIGYETLKASVSDCITTYEVTQKLEFGGPTASYNIYCYNPLDPSCYQTESFYIFRPSLILGEYATSYQWSYRINGTTNETIIPSTGFDGAFIFSSAGTYDVMVRPVNDCGIGNPSYSTISVVDLCGFGFNVVATPNPADEELTITTKDENSEVKMLPSKDKVIYQLVDINKGGIVKQWIFDNSINTRKLNVAMINPGQYILTVIKGKYQKGVQVLIK